MNIKTFFILFSSVIMLNNFCYAAAEVYEDGPLHHAVRARDESVLLAKLAEGHQIESKGALQRTPLFLAIHLGYADMVHVLLYKQANPYAYDQFNRSVLHEALDRIHNSNDRKRYIHILKLLLDHDHNLADFWGKENKIVSCLDIPLLFALYKNDLELFALLLSHAVKSLLWTENHGINIIPQGHSLLLVNKEETVNLSTTVIPITLEILKVLGDAGAECNQAAETLNSFHAYLVRTALQNFGLKITEALDASMRSQKKIDILGYDSCLMEYR